MTFIDRYMKAISKIYVNISKHKKDYDKNRLLPYLTFCNVNSFCGRCSKNCLLMVLNGLKKDLILTWTF